MAGMCTRDTTTASYTSRSTTPVILSLTSHTITSYIPYIPSYLDIIPLDMAITSIWTSRPSHLDPETIRGSDLGSTLEKVLMGVPLTAYFPL